MYENIYIGNFIYLLGLHQGLKIATGKAASLVCSMNLFQQTPYDPFLGDFLGAQNGRNFLIEFKRAANTSLKEDSKMKCLMHRIQQNASSKMLLDISTKAHFYLEIECPAGQYNSGLITWVCPYLLYDQIDQGIAKNVDVFIDDILEEHCGVSFKEMKLYLAFLLMNSDDNNVSGLHNKKCTMLPRDQEIILLNIDNAGNVRILSSDLGVYLDRTFQRQHTRTQERGFFR